MRDRIQELRRVRAGDLRPHPENWRVHPESQQNALRMMLDRVGWVDAVIARETDDGLELIDGHLRAELDPDQEIPVLIVDLNDAEAAEVLATVDPLASMAMTDSDVLESLVGKMPDASPIEDLLEGLDLITGPEPPPPEKQTRDIDDQARLDERKIICPECGHGFPPP